MRRNGAWRAAAILATPSVYGPKVSRHVILAIKLLGTHRAWVRLSVQVSSDIVPVEIGRMGVRVVADLASVSVSLLDAKAANADGIVVSGRGRRSRVAA